MHAAHHQHGGVGVGSLAGQGEGVAHEVGYLLYLGTCVVMGQDDGVALLGQLSHALL